MKARVIVTLKSGVLDPQGKAIEGALGTLGVTDVESVRQGKVFDVEIGGSDPQGALRLACEKLLANTVVENYAIEVLDARHGAAHPAESDDHMQGETAHKDVTEIAARDTDMPTEGHP